MKKLCVLLAAAMLVAALSGCASDDEVAALQQQVEDLQAENEELTELASDLQERLDAMISEQEEVEAAAEAEAEEVEADSEETGIENMYAGTVTKLMNTKYGIPEPEIVEADASLPYAASCSSIVLDGDYSYDYSMTLDGNNRVIGASFGLTSTGPDIYTLLGSSIVYFKSAIACACTEDDVEELESWFNESIADMFATASEEAYETTVGGVTYSLSGDINYMYVLDIHKA